jgi:hypothetical protein
MRIKPNLLFNAACVLMLLFSFQFLFATGGGKIMGRVTDPDTKAPAGDVTVVFDCLGNQTSCTTNDSGYYYSANLPVGVYTITASYMSNHSTITGVRVLDDQQQVVDLELTTAIQSKVVVITGVYHPVVPALINPVEPTTVNIDRGTFTKEPITKVADITEQQVGVTEVNGVFYVRGAREGALKYYIDGAPVMASADIPLAGLENYSIYTGFIPPKYGDTVGGVVVLETRNYFSENH